MKVREFLEAVRAQLEAGGHDGLTTTLAFSYVQAHFGDRRVHFECWVQRKTGLLELGLHFEGPREFSYGWAAAIGEHMPELVAALGDGIELEEWTERWTRLHETRRSGGRGEGRRADGGAGGRGGGPADGVHRGAAPAARGHRPVDRGACAARERRAAAALGAGVGARA